MDLRERGTTILVSSHILAELEDYCTDMLVLKDGRLLKHVGLEDSYRHAGLAEIVITFLDAEDREKVAALPGLMGMINKATPDPANPKQLTVVISSAPEMRADLLKALVDAGLRVTAYEHRTSKLEDIYLSLTRNDKLARSV